MTERTPYAEGPDDAEICIIAEAPSYVEMDLGRPLVGPAGQVFNWCLKEAGLHRSRLKLLNVWEFEVIKKQSGGAFYDKHSQTLLWNKGKFTHEGLVAAEGFFRRLARWKGSVIVPMGNVALRALTGKDSVTKWRGSPLPADTVDTYEGEDGPPPNHRWTVPCLHPAATLAMRGQYHMRWTLVADLRKAQRFASGYTPAKRELVIDPTFAEAKEFLRDCAAAPQFCTDVELYTNRRAISCFSVSPDPSRSICIPLLDEVGQDRWTEQEETQIWTLLAEALASPSASICNQNLLFDLWVYWTRLGMFPRGEFLDPMLAQAVMYPDFKKDLGTLCSLYTDQPYYKADGGRAWFEGRGDARDIGKFWTYSALDSCIALEAWVGNDWNDGLCADLHASGYWETYQLAVQRFPLLLYMMTRGIKVDTEAWDALDIRVAQEIAELEEELAKLVGAPLNTKSPKQVQAYFYEELGIDPYISRKTGNPTTDDKALARIARQGKKGAREAEIIIALRGRNKLKDSYLDITWDKDKRLRASWNPAGANTGRLSSGQTVWSTGANLQNLEPTFKSFLVADDDQDAVY